MTGHTWSLLVTSGHIWSHLFISGHTCHICPIGITSGAATASPKLGLAKQDLTPQCHTYVVVPNTLYFVLQQWLIILLKITKCKPQLHTSFGGVKMWCIWTSEINDNDWTTVLWAWNEPFSWVGQEWREDTRRIPRRIPQSSAGLCRSVPSVAYRRWCGPGNNLIWNLKQKNYWNT